MNDKDSRLLSEAYDAIKANIVKEGSYTPISGRGESDYEWHSKDGYYYFVTYSYDAHGRSYSRTYDEDAYTDATFDIDIHEITRSKEEILPADQEPEVVYSGEDPKTLSPEALQIYRAAMEYIDEHLRETVELEPDYDEGYND